MNAADKLEQIFSMQHALQGLAADRYDMVVPRSEDRTKQLVLAAIVELAEVLDETNWKPWKNPSPSKPDRELICGEIVDVLHFVVNLCIVWEMGSDELLEKFRAKHAVNMRRQLEGY